MRWSHFHPALNRSPRTCFARPGFTLMEMLLVLAILAVIGAMAWPSIRNLLEAETIRQAAGQVRNCWGKARVLAMKTGRIYAFQYKPGSVEYRLQVWYAADDQLEASDGSGPVVTPSGIGGQNLPQAAGEGEQRLPEGISFSAGQTSDTRGAQVAAEKMSKASGEELSWSSPIFFYPDGTASAAEVVLAGQDNRLMQLDLRGLTGIARVGPVDEEKLQEAQP